ncbi:uncharacterized protein N7479_005216 [Penicillium vulpinum]|uniref:Restriction endonuclease domain-containing protein n=1 Tax=Penicillium vulpinum TaxID=29845 RepID=A0A1V6RFW5_9EURO|nr:uncharacterized protein N7479_005216 [Penicillium vulpinum]KAJ5958066.1 hypothetical protein N7479_005216 [Penicillium vulpinum]OQE00293.1 hypothetical protein PENVUL_c054G07282 [Penicillium vulpinum]
MTALPPGAVTRIFSSLEYVQLEAQKIIETLEKDEEENGNQFLGVNYRFEFGGGTGILRMIPGCPHEYTTMGLLQKVTLQLINMGLSEQYRWGGKTRYESPLRQKEGDQVFSPSARWPSSTSLPWPTMVIETGVSDSLPRLRQDAKWWFGASDGEVCIVIILSIKKTAVHFEQWQLAPPNAPRPLTRAYIDGLRQNPSNVPPLLQQPSNMQQPYSCAEVDLTKTSVAGAPVTIPYCALFDVPVRPPDMQDVVLNVQDFRFITGVNFS